MSLFPNNVTGRKTAKSIYSLWRALDARANVKYTQTKRHYNAVEADGSLLLALVGVEDEGLYECGVENETSFVDRVNVTVRSK
ncbi:unnamed protein product [Leptosia nina]|uniref:Ig-like domain-containing protein n=1 Tax=Leptosia nina TaxID=320188 RepID=A0AAV1JTB7_9NEOP